MSKLKAFKTRDAATSLLRKMGVSVRDYSLIIVENKSLDKPYLIDLEFVEEFLKDLPTPKIQDLYLPPPPTMPADKSRRHRSQVTPPTTPSSPSASPTPQPLVPMTPTPSNRLRPTSTTSTMPKSPRRTVSSVCRELILQGQTNDEIYAAIVTEFNVGADKKHYPSWYRCDLRKKGLIQ